MGQTAFTLVPLVRDTIYVTPASLIRVEYHDGLCRVRVDNVYIGEARRPGGRPRRKRT